MDETRFGRLENRVDEIKDDVSEIKAEQKVMSNTVNSLKEDVKEHTQAVKEHVAGDDKIVTQLQPLLEALPHLTEVVKDFQYKKETKERRKDRLKSIILRLSIPATLVGIIGGLAKIFS